jgi:hypothetical protein
LKLRALCAAGASLADVDAEGLSALHRAAEAGHTVAVRILLEHAHKQSATVNDRCSRGMWDGATALFMASTHGHSDVVRELLNHGAAVDIDHADRTPLQIAAMNGHTKTVRVLVGGGADHTRRFPAADGKTPRQWAAARGHHAVIALLGLSAAAHEAHISTHRLACVADAPDVDAYTGALVDHFATHLRRLGGRPELESRPQMVPQASFAGLVSSAGSLMAASLDPGCDTIDEPDVHLHRRKTFTDSAQRSSLLSNLPLVLQLESWHLTYSSTSDGSSLASLCRHTNNTAPLILACQSTDGQIFGGFITHPLTAVHGGSPASRREVGGVGRGEAWLFAFRSGAATASGTTKFQSASGPAVVFRWTRANESFLMADPGGSGIGALSTLRSLPLAPRLA